MASFREVEAGNPNIREQYDTWRRERQQNNEDPTDYAAFRKHVIAIGAPDPGEEPISDAHFS